jgi:UDP-N-acetylmuramoyl-L-alanyl-D-glutamate--2,6-diaminopimelate ligase
VTNAGTLGAGEGAASGATTFGELVAAVPGALLIEAEPAASASRTPISVVVMDSREAIPGAMFVAVRGAHVDGHDHAEEAVRGGAVALLVERRLPGIDALQVVVRDTRAAVGHVASRLWGHPSRKLKVVGITGTNGKTTTSAMLASIVAASGASVRTYGTLSGARTTDEAPRLQRTLAQCAESGTDVVVMEVSSHALALGRVDGTRFAVGVFTNLGRDHLDFHGSEQAYFAAKSRLFLEDFCARIVVNRDDEHGRLLAGASRVPTATFARADASNIDADADGARFRWRGTHISIPIAGEFNIDNALCAATAAAEMGIDPTAIAAGLAATGQVAGRFETITARGRPRVIVDYAHTPDGMEQVIAAVRSFAAGRVTVVFGCGGDRDRGKRPLMGATAARLADRVVVTSDNPRSEDPDAIIAEIAGGMPIADLARVHLETDRRLAIATAIDGAAPDDVVLVLGKGHEKTQEFDGLTVPFDDREVVRAHLFGAGADR